MTHPNLFDLSNFPHRMRVVNILVALTVAVGMGPVQADDLKLIKDLQASGKFQDALAKVNKELASKPKDAQLRFIKGVLLADSGRSSEAIGVFQRLTEDNPKLPEPFNNLAVLYASAGQFEKAKLALEAAIRTNPSYSTAHENLGDVYSRMAADAYGKALQLDVSKTQVQSKLSMIRDLVPVTPVPAEPKLAVSAGTPARVVPSAPVPVPVPVPARTPVVVATAKPEAAKNSALAIASAPKAATPMMPLPVSKAVVPPPVAVQKTQDLAKPPVIADTKPVVQAIEAWASAWSARDVSAYLASYSPDFVPFGGASRKAWEDDRKARILGKSKINVKLSSLIVSMTSNGAVAQFRQEYSADALQTSTRKTLHLIKRGDRWLISKEVSG